MQGSSTQTQTNTYAWYDGAVITSTTVTGTGAQTPGVTTYTNNAFGLMTYSSTTGAQSWTASYVYDAASQGICKTQTGPTSTFSVATKRMGGIELVDPNGATVEDPSSTGIGTYTVRSGDTLVSVAAALWGDASLWYLLAQANGLTSDDSVTGGQVLVVPAQVTNFHNSAATYKPYDAAQAIGDVAPGAPKPPKKKNCFGMILLAVIAIAVAAIAGPEIIGFFQGALGATFTAAGAVVGGSFGAIAGGAIGGAVTGALASIVIQGVGVATGIQDKFSWKQVGLAAVAGGIGGGLEGSGIFGNMTGKVFEAGKIGIKSAVVDAAVRGMVSSVLTQGISVATGLQDKFSWAGVAGAGVSAAVGQWAGGGLKPLRGPGKDNTLANHLRHLGTSSAALLANAATRSVIEGTDFGDNIMAALPDTIAQTVFNAVAYGVTTKVSGTAGDAGVDEPRPGGDSTAGANDTPSQPAAVQPVGGNVAPEQDGASIERVPESEAQLRARARVIFEEVPQESPQLKAPPAASPSQVANELAAGRNDTRPVFRKVDVKTFADGFRYFSEIVDSNAAYNGVGYPDELIDAAAGFFHSAVSLITPDTTNDQILALAAKTDQFTTILDLEHTGTPGRLRFAAALYNTQGGYDRSATFGFLEAMGDRVGSDHQSVFHGARDIAFSYLALNTNLWTAVNLSRSQMGEAAIGGVSDAGGVLKGLAVLIGDIPGALFSQGSRDRWKQRWDGLTGENLVGPFGNAFDQALVYDDWKPATRMISETVALALFGKVAKMAVVKATAPAMRKMGEVLWVDEPPGRPGPARDYNDSTPGARSNVQTRNNQVPALQFRRTDGTMALAKFDGVDADVMIDRKWSIVTTQKVRDQALRQSEALSQNERTGRWEVINRTQAIRAERFLRNIGIENITVRIVRP